MTLLSKLASSVSRVLALIGAFAVVVMMMHICLDVVLRGIFRITIPVTIEMVSRYYMVGLSFLPLAWLERQRQMISVELIEFALSPMLMRISDVIVCLLTAACYSALAWTTWEVAFKNFSRGTYVELATFKMAVWHSYFLPPIGFTLASLAALLTAVEFARGKDSQIYREQSE